MKFKWKDNFSSDVLSEGREFQKNIERLTIGDKQINAIFKRPIHVYIRYDEDIEYMSCTCTSKSNCKHLAAALYYVEDNDLIEKDEEFNQLIKSLDENVLKEYFKEILHENNELKDEFFRKFKKEPKIDAAEYFEKLEHIIEKSKGGYYSDFALYDIDVLGNLLCIFIDDDIDKLIEIRQYEVVFQLLITIGELLKEELYIDEDSWYDACESYLHVSDMLEETYIFTDEELDKLDEYSSFMRGHM